MEEIEIKKSRFLCYLRRCACEEEAKAFIQAVKKQHPNANHHCYAFLIGEHNEIARSCDDGEPSGTAGMPMLHVLTAAQMQDTIAVCVRYFGGIKLGASGLLRAYSKSVSTALAHACFTKRQTMLQYTLHFPYPLVGKLDYFFRQHAVQILQTSYAEDVCYTYISSVDQSAAILEISNGACTPIFEQEVRMDIDCEHEKIID